MTKSVTIRPARPQESGLLSELAVRSKAHWGYSPAFPEACRAELSVSGADIARPHRHCFVAELDGQIAGFHAVERLSAEEYEFDALFVEPRHIGQGIGRALIEHAKSYARSDGARFLVIQGDPNATSFYRAAGGVLVGERESGCFPSRYLPEFRILLPTADAIRQSGAVGPMQSDQEPLPPA